MKIILDGKVTQVYKTEKTDYVTFGDMDTFSSVKLNLPGTLGLQEKMSYHVEADAQLKIGKSGIYIDVIEASVKKLTDQK